MRGGIGSLRLQLQLQLQAVEAWQRQPWQDRDRQCSSSRILRVHHSRGRTIDQLVLRNRPGTRCQPLGCPLRMLRIPGTRGQLHLPWQVVAQDTRSLTRKVVPGSPIRTRDPHITRIRSSRSSRSRRSRRMLTTQIIGSPLNKDNNTVCHKDLSVRRAPAEGILTLCSSVLSPKTRSRGSRTASLEHAERCHTHWLGNVEAYHGSVTVVLVHTVPH